MLTPLDKLLYTARQGARVAWFMGHYLASRSETPAKPSDTEAPRARGRGPSRERLYGDIARLFASDLANAEAGHYPLPRDHDGSLPDLIATSRAFFADLPEAHQRMAEGRGDEIRANGVGGGLPDYFLQNFHYQTGGYLTEHSARLYDMQVEVLFSGTANAMRRHCLVPLSQYLKDRDQRTVRLLDVACGTGRFLRSALEAWPRLDVQGADLSEAYVAEARRHLDRHPRARLHVANAEALPFEDASVDIVSAIYLFHELPPEVRRKVTSEFARVLKPGGQLIFMDSLQIGDTETYDGLLEAFPERFHEPYYAGYLREDLPSLFAEAGLRVVEEKPVFLSKLVVAEK
ncbi:MAG: methyltransferase domain-containing protein [Parvibaculaceae bacterium]